MEKDSHLKITPPEERSLIESLTPDASMFDSDDKARNRQIIVGMAKLDIKLIEIMRKMR